MRLASSWKRGVSIALSEAEDVMILPQLDPVTDLC